MSSNDGSPKDERSIKQAANNLTICVFLGGLTFTAMTLLLQNKDNFKFEPVSSVLSYPELLMDGMAVVSALFIIGAVGMSVLGAGREKSKSKYGKLSFYFMVGGLIGLCVLLPLMILPFSLVGAIGISIVVAAGLLFLQYSNKVTIEDGKK